jgi:hypothetical protein
VSINYDEKHRLAAGNVELRRDKLERSKEKLERQDRELVLCKRDQLRIEGEIQDHLRNGSGGKKLDGLREKLNNVQLKEQALLAERAFLERLVKEAEEKLALAIVDAHTANRQRLQQQGVKLAASYRQKVREIEELFGKLEETREQERIAKDSSRGGRESASMPSFEWITQIDGYDRDLLRTIFDRARRAADELENRTSGRPGGITPGKYSMDQQRLAQG